MQHDERKIVENINRGFHDETWLISSGQTFTENQEESMRSMQKKQKVFVQATSEADERKTCWVGSYSQSYTMPRGARETSVSCFDFCRDLASASLAMKQPKETAQAKDISKCGSVV